MPLFIHSLIHTFRHPEFELTVCSYAHQSTTKIGQFRLNFIRALTDALGDSLCPGVIKVSFQRAGIYNRFYHQRCTSRLPSRVEEARAAGRKDAEEERDPKNVLVEMTSESYIEGVREAEARSYRRDGASGGTRSTPTRSSTPSTRSTPTPTSTRTITSAPYPRISSFFTLLSPQSVPLPSLEHYNLRPSSLPKRKAAIEEEDAAIERKLIRLRRQLSSEDSSSDSLPSENTHYLNRTSPRYPFRRLHPSSIL